MSTPLTGLTSVWEDDVWMTVDEVRDEAIIEASVEWDLFTFDTEADFLAWVTLTTQRVVDEFAEKAGSAWDLDEPSFRDAVVFMVTSKLLRKLGNQSNATMLTGEDITVGPISIRAPRAADSVRNQIRSADQYERRAWVKMMAMGVGLRRGTLKRVRRYVSYPLLTVNDSHVRYVDDTL